MPKNDYVTLRVDAETKAYLKKMAERQRRSMSNLLSTIVLDAIDRDKRGDWNEKIRVEHKYT